jgi:hypothetical protein
MPIIVSIAVAIACVLLTAWKFEWFRPISPKECIARINAGPLKGEVLTHLDFAGGLFMDFYNHRIRISYIKDWEDEHLVESIGTKIGLFRGHLAFTFIDGQPHEWIDWHAGKPVPVASMDRQMEALDLLKAVHNALPAGM